MIQDSSNICKVCGKSLDDHALILRFGVAHAASYDPKGSLRDCSEADADWNNISGRIEAWRTVMRSLRWHAGRLDTAGYKPWYPDDLRSYADKIAADIARLIRVTQEHYAWTRQK